MQLCWRIERYSWLCHCGDPYATAASADATVHAADGVSMGRPEARPVTLPLPQNAAVVDAAAPVV
jgi:hypothetical protein